MTHKRLTNRQIDAALAKAPFPMVLDIARAAPLIAALELPAAEPGDCWKNLTRRYGRRLLERVIERATTGNPAYAAYCLARDCKADAAWARGVIERATTGNPAAAAYWVFHDGKAGVAWAQEIRRKWERKVQVQL